MHSAGRHLGHAGSADDDRRAGRIFIPAGTAPQGGWPVMSWAHGTTGIADMCAPSLSPEPDAVLQPYLSSGYMVVATDYEGLGTPGRHPYLVGASEGRGVLDIVRAARHLDGVSASSRYVVFGHSQGGHASLFAGQIAATWAPEIELEGVVGAAPASHLSLIYSLVTGGALPDTAALRTYAMMFAAGYNAAYGVDLAQVLSPAALAMIPDVDVDCGATLAQSVQSKSLDELFIADPNSVPEWSALLAENDPGHSLTPAPVIVVHGERDQVVPFAASQLPLSS